MPAHRDEIEDVGADHGAIRHALAYHCSPQPHVGTFVRVHARESIWAQGELDVSTLQPCYACMHAWRHRTRVTALLCVRHVDGPLRRCSWRTLRSHAYKVEGWRRAETGTCSNRCADGGSLGNFAQPQRQGARDGRGTHVHTRQLFVGQAATCVSAPRVPSCESCFNCRFQRLAPSVLCL